MGKNQVEPFFAERGGEWTPVIFLQQQTWGTRGDKPVVAGSGGGGGFVGVENAGSESPDHSRVPWEVL